MGLVPYPHVAIMNLERYLSCRSLTPRSKGSQLTSSFPVCSTSTRKKSLYNIWLWKLAGIQSIWVHFQKEGFWKPYKGPCTDSLTHRYLYWALVEAQRLRRYQIHTGRNWIMCLQGKNWRDSSHLPVLNSPTMQPAGICWQKIWICISLENSTCPTLMTPWNPTQPNTTSQRLVQRQEAGLKTFFKTLKILQDPDREQLALSVLCTF